MINLTVDNIKVEVKEGMTILEAAKKAKIEIPTLCYLKDLNRPASCRMCMVDVGGKLFPACVTHVAEGMNVKTHTKRLRNIRKTILELTLANHNCECTTCEKSGNCKLQTMANKYLTGPSEFETEFEKGIDNSSSAVTRDLSKCIKCNRCVSMCRDKVGASAISLINRSEETTVATPFNMPIIHSDCIGCGQCITVCPTGALIERGTTEELYDLLGEDTYYNICLLSHGAYETLAKGVGVDNALMKAKVVDVLNKLGFAEVIDYEEYLIKEMNAVAYLLKENMLEGKPLIYSCSSGIRREIEDVYPEADNLFVNLSKIRKDINTRFKEGYLDRNIDKDVHLTRVENCTAFLPETNETSGIDISITTRQLAKLIKTSGIDLNKADNKPLDNLDYTGVFNPYFLSVNTAYAIIRLGERASIKNDKGNIKEFSFDLSDGKKIKCAVVNGLKASKEEVKRILDGESEYNFLCVIPCEGGCEFGGGRPVITK